MTWQVNGRALVICNGRAALDAVDAATGELVWSVDGAGIRRRRSRGLAGGAGRKPQPGLVAYRRGGRAGAVVDGAFDALRNQSSPIVHEGAVFLADNDAQACYDAATARS